MEAILMPIFMNWVQQSNPGGLVNEIVTFVVAFWIVKKFALKGLEDKIEKVGIKAEEHGLAMQKKFGELIGEVSGLKNAIVRVEKEHLKEIDGVKLRVSILESKSTKGDNNV